MVVLLKRLKGFVSAIISHIYKNVTDGNGKFSYCQTFIRWGWL
jgi:hypothetical protein